MEKYIINPKGQAQPSQTIPVTKSAFEPRSDTAITWIGGAGLLINARGTTLLIDPLLTGFDMPVLFPCPLAPDRVPLLDGYLVTHIDNDHFSRETVRQLASVTRSFHATKYVAGEMRAEGVPGQGHAIGESFQVGDVHVTLTPAKHNWQNGLADFAFREWKEEDYCGFWMDTPDGSIWLPGDSKLLDSHLHMPRPKVILFDFSDNDWHITLDGAIRLANAYPDARLVLIHWGTVDAPDMSPFNGNPANLISSIVNPDRVCVLWPGEEMKL